MVDYFQSNIVASPLIWRWSKVYRVGCAASSLVPHHSGRHRTVPGVGVVVEGLQMHIFLIILFVDIHLVVWRFVAFLLILAG